MKINKTIIFLLCLLSLVSCKDKVTSNNIVERTTNNGQQDPGDRNPNDISPYPFAGVKSIDEINQTNAKLHWDLNDHAASYHVFLIVDNELVHQISLNHPKNNIVIKDLSADSNYEVLIRMMDKQGRLDNNQNSLSFKTSKWPPFVNTKSVFFNGSQGLQLGASDTMISNDRYTISLWFKTNQSQVDKKLITFHSDYSASTAVNFTLNNSSLSYQYKDSFAQIKSIDLSINYADSNWHHVVASFNGKWHTLYLNGKRMSSIEDTFYGFGSHFASIGSFTGMQKGFTGLIDEVSIWNSAIGKGDIEDIYNNHSPFDLKQHRRIGVLKAWYRMGDLQNDTGTKILDVLGNFDASSSQLNQSSIKIDTAN